MFAPNFSNLAPALVSTAEVDPLRDEGECYAEKLMAAGTEVDLIRYAGAPHTFATMDSLLSSGREYIIAAIRTMKRVLQA